MKKAALTLLVAALFVNAPRPAQAYPLRARTESSAWQFHESNSGVRGPTSAQILSELQVLSQNRPEQVTYIPYGKSVRGQTLGLVKLQDKRVSLPAGRLRKAVLISGATHGNEYLGFEEKLPRLFLEGLPQNPGLQRFLQSGGLIYIIPIVNPDGYDARVRENANRVDLNRDFPLQQFAGRGFTQPESKALGEVIASELRREQALLTVSVDYHCCYGALLHPYSYSRPAPPPLPTQDLQAFLGIGRILQTIFGAHYNVSSTAALLGYDAVGTTKDYYYETAKALAFTFEGEGFGDDKVEKHLKFWDDIFGHVSVTPPERWLGRP